MTCLLIPSFLALAVFLGASLRAAEPRSILDKQKLLEAQTFWDNRDWDWYERNIPFFESPDGAIDSTYYYRWELVTKHLTYGSPATGYSFTEFMDRPFWSGTYGAISCAAGFHLGEVRWLRDPRIARDYSRYWFRTPGAQPRNYSAWLADAVWGVHEVHPDDRFLVDLLPDLIKNYEGWVRERFTPEVGLFWQTGHADGMETNINSRQTKDGFAGAPGYRPTLNAYLWADAVAIAKVARLAGDSKTADDFNARADALKANLQKKLWDPKRDFYFHMFKNDEELDGVPVKALTLTYRSGKFAGNEHGRELIGYVPWEFNMPDPGRESAWKFLNDPDYFAAPFGPTVTERHDPLFLISLNCCVWSGQSWPYATTQTLVALANVLNHYKQTQVSKNDYFSQLKTYTLTQRMGGRPYIAEAANPDTGSWEGHNNFNHSEHYFHSGYVDLIITGLVGLRPRADDAIDVNPLVPAGWPYFALDDVPYHGHRVAIVWDETGKRYGLGAGLHVLADGRKLVSSPTVRKLTAPLPPLPSQSGSPRLLNYAVNNDGTRFPRAIASFTSEKSALEKINDGNYWYLMSPPNRWTCQGSKNERDWCGIDFGVKRRVSVVKLYVLDDGKDVDQLRLHPPSDSRSMVAPPSQIDLEYWDGRSWVAVPGQKPNPLLPYGHMANTISFPTLDMGKVRAVFTHAGGSRTGLTEFESWGEGTLPVAPAPTPPGNLALNETGKGRPSASASFTSRFDQASKANNGRIELRPNPNDRWTSYESPNPTDWLAIDFGHEQEVGKVDLHIFDDRGGVQAPSSFVVQFWDGKDWLDVPKQVKKPTRPAGGRINTVTFPPVKTSKVRVVFTHKGEARSGLTEIEIWRE